MSRILHSPWKVALVAKSRIINKTNTAHPVTMVKFALSFSIILTSYEVPHEVTPEHPITLIVNKITKVLTKCRDCHPFGCAVGLFLCGDAHLRLVDIAFVNIDIRLLRAVPHTREERLDVVVVDIIARVFGYFHIFTFFAVLIIYRSALGHIVRLCRIIWTVKERSSSILFAVQVGKH